MFRECGLQHFMGTGIILRLAISGIKHSFVHYQEIGIGSGQAFTINDDCIWHRQGKEAVGGIFQCAEGFELFFHQV